MSLERWFGLLQYMTLGLSCVALVFAEEPFLPGLQICLPPVLALLILAWWVEGRWALPNWGANILGLFIVAAGITWLLRQLSDNDYVLAHLPLHLALLPYMGPLAMAALVVKVFRERDAGHFWHVQSLGLMQIGLGCVLDGGPDFGAAMAAYLAGALACLALHYRLSGQRSESVLSGSGNSLSPASGIAGAPQLPSPSPRATRRWLVSFTLGWTLLIGAMSLLLFLFTPRQDNWSWQPLNKLSSGYSRGRQSENEEMNLNSIGRIELDNEVAFHVLATVDGKPKLDLPADQRWRGSVLDGYEHGKWLMTHLVPPHSARRPPSLIGQDHLPDLGPGQFFLDFTIQPRQAGGLVLAEPIRFGPRGESKIRLPVMPLPEGSRRHLFAEISGTVLSQVFSDNRHDYHYRQVMLTRGDNTRIPVDGPLIGNELTDLRKLPKSLQGSLQKWTIDLLRRLPNQPRYFLSDRVRASLEKATVRFQVDPFESEGVARALTNYLAFSGEYHYSLQLTRHDRLIDPVLDFLMNVKRGHCERYAAALALMLRSIGIPSRVVKGFRGCDSEGRGRYLVRHSHAHAWVEILAQRSIPYGKSTRMVYDWVTLDATPPSAASEGDGSSLSYVWDKIHRFFRQSWRGMIVEYNGDEQAELWDELAPGRPSIGLLRNLSLGASALVVVVGACLVLRRQWHRRRRRPTLDGDAAIYSRLVRILGRYASLRPNFGQTPREYAAAAQMRLRELPGLALLAELPMRVVELFYRVRFGSRPLREAERQKIDAELDQFAAKLRA